jgi:predicted acylesterase/phospholipase RssA
MTHKIENLVLPACAQNLLFLFGAVFLLKNKFWNITDLKTIHACSAGSFIAILILLDIDTSIIENYIIDRPWYNLLPKFSNLFNIFHSENGLLDKSILYTAFDPLFKITNIDINITLRDFFTITQKKLYIYTSDIIDFKEVILNHETHPDLPLIDAVYMSCTIPIIFKPITYNNKIYIDGALFNQHPSHNLATNSKYNTILFKMPEFYIHDFNINSKTFFNIYEFIHFLLKNCFKNMQHKTYDSFKYQVYLQELPTTNPFDIKSWKCIFYSKEYRKNNIEIGKQYSRLFLSKMEINTQINNIHNSITS